MEDRYKIMWYDYYPSPWDGMARKMWMHHSHIMRLINKDKKPLEIHCIIKPQNKSKIRKYEEGDVSVITKGYEDIKFVFHETSDVDYVNEMDACFMEPGRCCIMDELYAGKGADQEVRDAVFDKIKRAMSRNLPILWYDGDCDLMRSYDSDNYAKRLYDDLEMNEYSKCLVVGPYQNSQGKLRNFKFVPYNIDFEVLPTKEEIKDSSERKIMSTYFGSNYHRDNFIPYFNKVSEHGEMRIYGSSWNPKKLPNVNLNKAIWLSEGEFNQYYDESLFGLYGGSGYTEEFEHFIMRAIEYLNAGIYIIIENKKYLTDKFPENNILTSDLDNFDEFESKINDLKDNYSEKVIEQRKFLEKTFDSRNYVDTYLQGLGLL